MRSFIWMCGVLACVACGEKAAPVAPPNAGEKPTIPVVVTPPTTSAATYDVDALGVPRIASASYIDLAPILRVSMFRSAFGHDYHDAFESCRSMKHYFQPVSTVDWRTIPISSPVDGTIAYLRAEQTFGTQVSIRSTTQPAFTFIIFHVRPVAGLDSGARVTAGQRLGVHIGTQTMSDIAVGVSTPGGYKLVSWFETMTDELFASYAARGVAARSSAIITKADRDNNRLTCDGEAFVGASPLENWLTLK